MISRRRRPIENERSEQIHKIYKISFAVGEKEKTKWIYRNTRPNVGQEKIF